MHPACNPHRRCQNSVLRRGALPAAAGACGPVALSTPPVGRRRPHPALAVPPRPREDAPRYFRALFFGTRDVTTSIWQLSAA